MRARLHALWRALLHEHTHPPQVAAAVWVGVVVGCTPLFGFHLPICIALAWLLRLNKIIVYAAANISLPPIAAVLGFASVQLGMRVLEGHWLAFSLAVFEGRPLIENAKLFFGAWMIGGVLIGATIGSVLAPIAYVAMARRNNDAIAKALRRASDRYRACAAKYRFYAYFKYRMDPVYRAVALHVPPRSHTVDFGAGLNMLAVMLNELGEERQTTGLEWDTLKVSAARQAAPDVAITQMDVREPMSLPSANVVTIVDMLHYFPRVDVTTIIHRADALLGIDGTLLIRESDRARGSRWTRFVERSAVALGWNVAPGTAFLSGAELTEIVGGFGFSVEAQPVSGALHPGNVLYVCRRHRPAL